MSKDQGSRINVRNIRDKIQIFSPKDAVLYQFF